ncbi:MAG: EAL domain-containing protein [Sphingomonadaceae bacterium]
MIKGFCNFRYLKLLPLDYLKLDRAMVEGVVDDKRDLAVLRGIVAMAKALDLQLIAEGIENDDQRDYHRRRLRLLSGIPESAADDGGLPLNMQGLSPSPSAIRRLRPWSMLRAADQATWVAPVHSPLRKSDNAALDRGDIAFCLLQQTLATCRQVEGEPWLIQAVAFHIHDIEIRESLAITPRSRRDRAAPYRHIAA